ncbi:MAG: polymerase sigma-70 factor, subfamily [Acidobacteriota bacterium]|nr:polymerase sigma-70 factor, subfamily [Acidobacteriota bacterium]
MTTAVETISAWQSLGVEQEHAGETARPVDFELARRAAAGDMGAFEEIYRLHQRRVYSLCLRMTQNAAESEDLSQEVFVHLFKTINSFRGESHFTTWLHRMTVNQVLMHFRRKKRRRTESLNDGETFTEVASRDAGVTPSADALALDAAIAQLPPGYRAVLILHDVEGYEHEEIARMLGCAAGTSKSQLHKARFKLRTLLKRRAIKMQHESLAL